MSASLEHLSGMNLNAPDVQLISNIRRFPGVMDGYPNFRSFSRAFSASVAEGDLRAPNSLEDHAQPATLKSTSLRQLIVDGSFRVARQLARRNGPLSSEPNIREVEIRNIIHDWGSVYFAYLKTIGAQQDVTGRYPRTQVDYDRATDLWYEVMRRQLLKGRNDQTGTRLVISNHFFEFVSLTGLTTDNNQIIGTERAGRFARSLSQGSSGFGVSGVEMKQPWAAAFESSTEVKDYVVDLRGAVQQAKEPNQRRVVLESYGQEVMVANDEQVMNIQNRAANPDMIKEMGKDVAECIKYLVEAGQLHLPRSLAQRERLAAVLENDPEQTIQLVGRYYLPYVLKNIYNISPERMFIGYNDKLLEQVTFYADIEYPMTKRDLNIHIRAYDAVEDAMPELL